MIRKYLPAENESDFAALKAAQIELYNAADTKGFITRTFLPFREERIEGWIRTHQQDGVDYYVAEAEDGRVAGLAVTKADSVYGFELITLVVRPEFRGQGIGRRLVEQAVEAAGEAGFTAVDVEVYANNKPMLLLVIGLDFQPIKIDYHVRDDGADVVYLRRFL